MNHSTSPSQQQRILCYAPYNMWALHGMWEITILHTLKLRGADFRYVMCDGVFTECDLFWKATNPRHPSSCSQCRNQTEEFARNMGISFQWISQYLDKSDFNTAANWVGSLSIDNYLTANYGNWQIGTWVRSSVHSHFRMSELDFTDPEIKQVFENYLYSGLIACFGIDRLLDDYNPDVLLLFNGRMSSTRIAFSLAQLKNIRTITHERGFLKESILLKENGDCLDLRPIKQVWDDWGCVPLNKTELNEISSYLRDRENGQNLSWKRFSPTPQPLSLVRQQLQVAERSTVWVLFTSSDDEIIAADGLQGVFASQHEWISRTINYIKRHPHIRLIVRIHPNTAGKNATGANQQQLNALETLTMQSVENISFIMPEDEISSYSLMEIANIGLVYQSTVGLEMACKGKVVLVSAGSIISNLPFVKTIHSADFYEDILDGYLNLPFDYRAALITQMAYRYAYGIFFRYNITFPLVEMPTPHTGVLKYTATEELLPNKDASLDRIAGIILNNEHVCRPPEEHERNRSSADENAWFANKEADYMATRLNLDKNAAGPVVSVIIPCYNYAHYLQEALGSIIHQTFDNFEIIIVNDGSTDNTIGVAEELIAKYHEYSIRLITTPNSGNPAYPRNRGVKEANGEYILFLDADDMILPTFLEECFNLLNSNKSISIAYTNQLHFNDASSKVLSVAEYDFKRMLTDNLFAYCALFKKKAWLDVGGVPTDTGYEDWDFWIMCGEKGHIGKRIPLPLFCYRLHDAGRFKNELIVRDQLLRAQIIFKHSQHYAPDLVRKAVQLLESNSNSNYDKSGATKMLIEDEKMTLRMMVDKNEYNTDKLSYLAIYQEYFQKLQNRRINLLELGIFKGGSLLMWRDFFTNGNIVGLDINSVDIQDKSGRIKTYKGYQQDVDLLDSIRAESAPEGFDIIIDDASHFGSLTKISFHHLFEKHLNSGGIYVIEDWGTGYWPSWKDGEVYQSGIPHSAGMVGFIKELVDECGMNDITKPGLGAGIPRGSKIKSMNILSGIVFIVKN